MEEKLGKKEELQKAYSAVVWFNPVGFTYFDVLISR